MQIKDRTAFIFSSVFFQDPAAEARMKVACITEQVLTLVNKRLGLYRHFDEAVNKYKQSRDISTLNSGKKSLETEHKALTSEIAALQSKLKTEGSDLCDKVRNVNFLKLSCFWLSQIFELTCNVVFSFCSLYLSLSPAKTGLIPARGGEDTFWFFSFFHLQ